MQIFNFIKEERKQTLFNIINNIYFEKTLHSIIKNFDPRYINIEHKISQGENFNGILKKHGIPLKQINKIKFLYEGCSRSFIIFMVKVPRMHFQYLV